MSVDSTTLERSALERKDREELTTIAQALGAKPPSRARKAEIVQMILELTGVADPAAGAAAPAAAAAAPTAEAAPDAPADARGAAPGAPSAGNGGDAPAEAAPEPPSAPAQQPLADWEAAPSGGASAADTDQAGNGATTMSGGRNGAVTDAVSDAPAEQRPRDGGVPEPARGRAQGRGDRDRDRSDQGNRDQGKGDQSPSGKGGGEERSRVGQVGLDVEVDGPHRAGQHPPAVRVGVVHLDDPLGVHPRCTRPGGDAPASPRVLGDLQLDPGALSASVNGQSLALTAAEFRVLQLLVEHAGQVLSKEFLTEQVLQRKLTRYDRSIDVHVSRIRQKLGQVQRGDENLQIKAIRGVGYQLATDAGGDEN